MKKINFEKHNRKVMEQSRFKVRGEFPLIIPEALAEKIIELDAWDKFKDFVVVDLSITK